MNLMTFLNRGAAHAPSDTQRRQAVLDQAAEVTRQQWLAALTADQTRAWFSVGEADRKVLSGLAVLLTIAGFCSVFDTRDTDSVDLRVFRGAISAATQCSAGGSVVSAADAGSFHAACDRARRVIAAATVPAILHAAKSIRLTVGLACDAGNAAALGAGAAPC